MVFKRINAPEEDPPWGYLTGLGAVIAMFIAVAFVGSIVALTLLPNNFATAQFVGWSLGMLLTIGAVRVLVRGGWHGLRLAESSRMPNFVAFALGIGFAITVDLIVIFSAASVFSVPELSALPLNRSVLLWALATVFIMLLQPIAEELVFRGVLYPALRAQVSATAAIFISALFYGVVHRILYYSPTGATAGAVGIWVSLGEPVLVGVLLGGVRAYSGSTRAAIFTHAGFGLFALLKAVFILNA